jgi:hypothetical protein
MLKKKPVVPTSQPVEGFMESPKAKASEENKRQKTFGQIRSDSPPQAELISAIIAKQVHTSCV